MPTHRAYSALVALVLGVALVTTACTSSRALLVPPAVVSPPPATTRFSFASDTFAFANEIRSRHPDDDDLYANYCFVLARALRQFFAFARFDAAAPRLEAAGYLRLTREVVARPPWAPPLPAAARVVIPGYANLRELSAGEERAVKQALDSRFWSLVHWTNWRVTFPVTAGHQERVARAVVRELRAGRLVQLLVTNWPKPELNHTVVAYGFVETPAGVDFAVWDPNDPGAPGVVTFDGTARRFVATRLYDTEVGPIRVFRMAYSWWL
jgi:hypothetical protein